MRRRLCGVGAAVLVALAGVAPASAAGAGSGDDQIPFDVAARKAEWWLSGLGVSAAQGPGRGGAGVKVCLVDSGVDAAHEDLRGAHFADGKDFTGQGAPDGLKPNNSDPQSDHGTSMAAWIVGQGHGPNHSKGILGVAPQATLMSVIDSSDRVDSTERAFRYCVDRGAKVINSSNSYEPDRSTMAYVLQHDAVVVSSAGNRWGNPPTCDSFGGLQLGQLTVTGITEERRVAPNTCTNSALPEQRGEAAYKLPTGITLAAPSAGKLKPGGAAYPLVLAEPYNSYQVRDAGTSTAAALTSGVVALVRAAHPELKAGDVINRLIRTVSPVVGASSGVHGPVGFGVVNASAAVSANVASVGGANPLGDPRTGATGLWTDASWKGAADDASAQSSSSKKGDSSSGLVWVGVMAVVVLVGGGVAFGLSRKRRG